MYRIILSGGGTGGHIYPAVAVAEALRRRLGDRVELLFVGAEGKMEMEKVPALGYRIVGLPVAGLQRKLTLRNLALPVKVWKSCLLYTSDAAGPAGRSAISGRTRWRGSAATPVPRCCGVHRGWEFPP